ncbi:hypothetical protein [Desulfurivibrio sp. C05AmB]|uniref:hypothetical protein n=1 Tax=Desulfurivibrio sp. C05AmB TaxID=3374371 RepID=UPI00376F2312
MAIGRVLRRTLKVEFGKRKIPLPKHLSFLANIPFYAVTECLPPNSSNKQTRVEILPSSLKKVARSYEEYGQIKKENEDLLKLLEEWQGIFASQEQYIERLEKANNQLRFNLGEGPETPRSEYKSYLQVAQEMGFKPHGLPLQGGLPSLGKKQ